MAALAVSIRGAGSSTQEDPIGLAGGANLYGYAGGDPVNNSDPFGLCVPSWACSLAAKAATWAVTHPRAAGAASEFASNVSQGMAVVTSPNGGTCDGPGCATGALLGLIGIAAGTASPMTGASSAAEEGVSWTLGAGKSAEKWAGQMRRRGWTSGQIDEAISSGARYSADNLVNRGNAATRYVHPTTGRSVVLDNVTSEVIHVGGDGFKYP